MFGKLFGGGQPHPQDEQTTQNLIYGEMGRHRQSVQRRGWAEQASHYQDRAHQLDKENDDLRDENVVLREQLYAVKKQYAFQLLRYEALHRVIRHLRKHWNPTDPAEAGYKDDIKDFIKQHVDVAWKDEPLWDKVCERVEKEAAPMTPEEAYRRRKERTPSQPR